MKNPIILFVLLLALSAWAVVDIVPNPSTPGSLGSLTSPFPHVYGTLFHGNVITNVVIQGTNAVVGVTNQTLTINVTASGGSIPSTVLTNLTSANANANISSNNGNYTITVPNQTAGLVGAQPTNFFLTKISTNDAISLTNIPATQLTGTAPQSVIPSLPNSQITNTTTYTTVASTGVTIATNTVVTSGQTNVVWTFSASGGGGLTNALNVPLTYYGGTNISVVLNTNCAQASFSFIATNNFYLVQPTNMTPGFSFMIDVHQSVTGNNVMSVNTNYWKWGNGQNIGVTTNANAWTMLSCAVDQYGTNIVIVPTTLIQ